MRLLDEEADRPLAKLALYLTPKEAEKLQRAEGARGAGFACDRLEHTHISGQEHEHHLTLVVYEPGRAVEFQPRYRRLIAEDR